MNIKNTGFLEFPTKKPSLQIGCEGFFMVLRDRYGTTDVKIIGFYKVVSSQQFKVHPSFMC
jgi:hypothetical protein